MFDGVFRQAHAFADHKEETVMDSLPATLEKHALISVRLGELKTSLRVARGCFHPMGFNEALNG